MDWSGLVLSADRERRSNVVGDQIPRELTVIGNTEIPRIISLAQVAAGDVLFDLSGAARIRDDVGDLILDALRLVLKRGRELVEQRRVVRFAVRRAVRVAVQAGVRVALKTVRLVHHAYVAIQ